MFVPINTMAYASLPPSKNNAVSGIVNLSRNMGGDIGIAFVTTLIAQRAQFHQASLSAHLDPGNPMLQARLAAVARALERAGSSSVEAMRQATGAVYRELIQRAQTLAYLDVLWVLAWFSAAMVPLVFLTRRMEPRRGAMAH